MRGFAVRSAYVLAAVCLLLTLFVRVYAPLRAKRLAGRYEKFRRDTQAAHDAIDAGFHQQDTTVNGIRWHYIDEGAPDGKVIVFLHGLPEGWYSWRYVLPQVDHRYRLIAIDMKGYGRSDRHDPDYDWHHVAQQTAEFMDSLAFHKYYVVSHDWGTIIGSVLVDDHPDRILGYIRMEADLIPRTGLGRIANYLHKPQWVIFRSHFIASYMMQNPGWFMDIVYNSRMTTPFRPVDRDYLVYEFSRPGVADMVSRYFLGANWDLDSAIGKICTNIFPFPVLQLQADHDPAQPPSLFADAAAKCPNVKIKWVKNASHFDNFDQPAQIADAINRFVK